MPARNAPRPGDSLARLDTQAAANTTSSTASVNSSRSRLWAISRKSGRSSQWPAASTAPIASTPPATASRTARSSRCPGPAAESRGQRQERDEGEVLEEEHAEGEPTVGAVELGPLGELVQKDGGRAHGERAAHHDGRRPGDAAEPGQAGEYRRGGGDLRRAQSEHLAPHGDHARQGKLEAKRKKEEHDSELGEELRRGGAVHDRKRMRTQRQAHQKIRNGRRQPEPPGNRHEQHRDGEKNQNLAERLHGRIVMLGGQARARAFFSPKANQRAAPGRSRGREIKTR